MILKFLMELKKKDVSELQVNSVNDENPYLHVYAH